MDKVDNDSGQQDKLIFWGCFIALVATSFGFIVRTQVIGDWGMEFGLSETQKGEIFGVGLWPFAISIIVFSLIVDKIGYGTTMIFAFACHVTSAIVTIFADGYWMLYSGTFILALGNGTVEAVINPVTTTLFPREKTKWLNILHAGWPAGLVLGGILAILMGSEVSWKWKVALVLLPTAFYGVILFRRKFPVQERVKAGISFKEMLSEAGAIGFLIIFHIILMEVNRVAELTPLVAGEFFNLPHWSLTALLVIVTGIYFNYTKSFGRPMFILLLLLMFPLATTELGTDSWITELLVPFLGDNAGWVIVYTALIMVVLRFFAGPIVHKLSPLGLLAASSAIAIIGLVFLSNATGIAIFVAATIYGLGKTFFWPTMLGVTAERFPKGGALTLNAVGGVGMLAAGVIGAAFLGNIQDKQIDRELQAQNPEIHAMVMGEEKTSVFGKYKPLDQSKAAELEESEKAVIADVQVTAKQSALATVAIFPAIMLLCYLGLIFYFRSKGGYKAIELT
jgi:MFS family permease